MQNEIPPVPEVPDALREAAQVGKLIPFIGAGVSKLAGCPNWGEFANATLRDLVTRGQFSHAQLDQVKHLHPRIKLSIALALQARTSASIPFRNLLHREPRDRHTEGRRLYSHLSKLGNVFVTTNYDEWLDDQLPPPPADLSGNASAPACTALAQRTMYDSPEDFTASNLNQKNVVFHLHGSAKNPSGMILTTPQYVQHYANDRRSNTDHPENRVLTFLEYLFQNKTVLFVGYGLEELEILEYIIVKARPIDTRRIQPRHFLLQGFYSHERELMTSMRAYYLECGIGLLPFLKDQDGWAQLTNVLQSFGDLIPASTPMVSQELKEMGALLDD